MNHIKNLIILPPHKSNGRTSAENENGRQGKAASLMDRHIDRFWERMTKIYGHKWISSYGIADDGTWLSGLHDVSPEQVGEGLEKCRVSTEAWPPTLPEFRTMCLGIRSNTENAEAYRQYAALPKPPVDKTKALSHFATIRELLR